MFKTVVYVDSDDNILDVSECEYMISSIENQVVIISFDMLYNIDVSKFKSSLIIIVGADVHISANLNIEYYNTLKDCIKYLSNAHPQRTWWIVGSMDMMDDLIWNGAIMDMYIIKTNKITNTKNSKLNYNLLNDKTCQFTLTTKNKNPKILHYSRTNHEEVALLDAMANVVKCGSYRDNRTGIKTYSVFGKTMEYRMIERVDPTSGTSLYQFPLLTTKKMFLRGIFAELKWFLSGQTDSKILEEQGVNIWRGNSSREYLDSYGLNKYEEGKCGPIYGHQWRSWNAVYNQSNETHIGQGIDQVMHCINSLKIDPFSRRHIISGWNVDQIDEMALPPCHVIYQFYVHEEKGQKYLSLSMYQRSGDTFLGVPFNICSMGLFLLMMAHQVGYKPYKLVHTIGDMHIYENHIDAVTKQLIRSPGMFPFIGLTGAVKDNIEDYTFNDIIVDGYVSHASIRADMVA